MWSALACRRALRQASGFDSALQWLCEHTTPELEVREKPEQIGAKKAEATEAMADDGFYVHSSGSAPLPLNAR